MKAKIYFTLLIAMAFVGMSFTTGNEPLKIGETSPSFAELTTNLDGKDAVLRAYLQPKGIMVVFSSNTCPFVKAWEDRYFGLANYCKANNIGFVLINSNAAKRDGDDSFQAMKNHATEMKYTFPYLMDHNSTIANSFGAKATPQVYFFDHDMTLKYRGAIDDNHKDASKVTQTYALNALRNYMAGVAISPEITDALGCSIKRVK